MFTDPKKTIDIILAKKNGPPAPEESDEGDAGLETAMSDLSSALKSGDDSAAARAFRAAFDMLKSAPDEADDSSEE